MVLAVIEEAMTVGEYTDLLLDQGFPVVYVERLYYIGRGKYQVRVYYGSLEKYQDWVVHRDQWLEIQELVKKGKQTKLLNPLEFYTLFG